MSACCNLAKEVRPSVTGTNAGGDEEGSLSRATRTVSSPGCFISPKVPEPVEKRMGLPSAHLETFCQPLTLLLSKHGRIKMLRNALPRGTIFARHHADKAPCSNSPPPRRVVRALAARPWLSLHSRSRRALTTCCSCHAALAEKNESSLPAL